MAVPVELDTTRLEVADFVASIQPHELVYFLANIGDGDAQLVLLPEDPNDGTRRALIVDAGRMRKLPRLLDTLREHGLLPTHPTEANRGGVPRSDRRVLVGHDVRREGASPRRAGVCEVRTGLRRDVRGVAADVGVANRGRPQLVGEAGRV